MSENKKKFVICFTWRDYGSDCDSPSIGYWNGDSMFSTDDDALVFDTEEEAQKIIDAKSDEYDYGDLSIDEAYWLND